MFQIPEHSHPQPAFRLLLDDTLHDLSGRNSYDRHTYPEELLPNSDYGKNIVHHQSDNSI